MCGLAGFIDLNHQSFDFFDVIKRMITAIQYRGPDGEGIWSDRELGVGLGHKRLSILDLSAQGSQPMVSSSGRYVIAYNGETYNYKQIQSQLIALGYAFRGHSDTEVMLAAIEAWGLQKALSSFIGMFAFALWDNSERRLYLVRDRLGIKPLYFGHINGSFAFASELKALRTFPGFNNAIDRDAIALFLRHNYIPSPYSIYKGISKLLPGHFLSLETQGVKTIEYKIHRYWSAQDVVEQGQRQPFEGSEDEAIDSLDKLLKDSVKLRMLSDVPIGAFLSGGIDSSLVAAIMQSHSDSPIKTFTIGYKEQEYNEANYAKAVARHLNTEHTELYVSPSDAMSVIPKLSSIFDEPFSDSSQIPTYLVSQLARKHVTVSLSGDGGDELFYGYRRYFFFQRIWEKIAWMPPQIKRLIAYTVPASSRLGLEKLQKILETASYIDPDELYLRIMSHWKEPARVVIGAKEASTVFTDSERKVDSVELDHRIMYYDLASYLPDDILVKLDRTSMSVSLESRVPLLDHRVVELAWRLPLKFKRRNDTGKWILRELLYRYVPKSLLERPKKGFGIPIGPWLRGPLFDWAEALLDEKRLQHEGYFDPAPIRKKWKEHLQGKDYRADYLWDILMFQAWLEENG